VLLRAADLDPRELSRVGVERRRLVEQHVANRQRHRRGADSRGERHDCDGRGNRIPADAPRRAASVLHQAIEPRRARPLLEPLACDGDVAEPPPRDNACLVRIEAFVDQPVRFQLQVCLDLPREVLVVAFSG
jgi:hypothetical protein